MITIKVNESKMIIEADLSNGVTSKTGKSLIIASTNGFTSVDGTDYKVNLNVIKPRK